MQSKAWITLLQWKSWKNPLQLMPSDPAASVCLNMWSAGRGTLNGTIQGQLGPWRFCCKVGWQQGGFACGIACMTWFAHQKPALAAGLGKRRTLGVCGHFVTFSAALRMKKKICFWCKGGEKGKKIPHQKNHAWKKEKGCILHKWESWVQLTELPKQGFASGETLELCRVRESPPFSLGGSSSLSLGFVLLKELMKCPGLKDNAMKNLDLSSQGAVEGELSPCELLLSQLKKTRFDFRRWFDWLTGFDGNKHWSAPVKDVK